MMTYEVKFTVKAHHVTFVISVLLHLALMVFTFQQMSILEKKVKKTSSFEIDLKEQETIVASIEHYIEEGQIVNPEAHIYILKEGKVAKGSDELSDFFKKLETSNSGAVTNRSKLVSKSKSPGARVQVGKEGKNRLSNLAAALFANQYRPSQVKEQGQPLNVSKLKQLISANHNRFRSCYEKGLLTDELLSGNLEVTWSVTGKSGMVDFKGTGRQSAIGSLKECIKRSSARLKFPKEFEGKKVKFSLFFSS